MESIADAVIANRGLNFAGPYGYSGHGNFLGDGSAINSNVVANRDLGTVAAINSVTRDGFLSDQIRSGHTALAEQINGNSINDKFAALDRAVLAGNASAERLALANQATTMAQLHAMDVKQTECCCELKASVAAISAKLDADRVVTLQNEINILRMGRD